MLVYPGQSEEGMGRGGERPVHMGLVGHARILAFTRGSHRKILVKKKKDFHLEGPPWLL
jgi:hypothetical protein